MWTYRQSNGELLENDEHIAFGYSGAEGDGYNNPDMENIPCIGPIPRGQWDIVGPPFDSITHGPYVLRLIPRQETEVFGRSGFLCHGDRIGKPGTASEGCLVFGRYIRQKIWESGDTDLLVTV
jgi:hypothetical protein